MADDQIENRYERVLSFAETPTLNTPVRDILLDLLAQLPTRTGEQRTELLEEVKAGLLNIVQAKLNSEVPRGLADWLPLSESEVDNLLSRCEQVTG